MVAVVSDGDLREAQDLAVALQARFYPEVDGFQPLDSVSGVLSQISNMATGLVRDEADTESLADYCERRAREIRRAAAMELEPGIRSDFIAAEMCGAARALEEIAIFERRQGR